MLVHESLSFKCRIESLTWSFLYIINHGEWSMTELTRRVGCCMDASDLHELLSHVILSHITGALSETEQVLLVFQDLRDLLVHLQVLISHRHGDALWEHLNVTDQSFPPGLELFVKHRCFLIREPDADQCHGEYLRNKALNIGVAKTTLHIKADVLVIFIELRVWHRRRQ